MLWANDKNDDRVNILDTHSNQEYYCPTCGATLITRKGDVRQHHFAHKQGHLCSDTWERRNSHNYDTSHWHNEWQSNFPKENQEVILALGETKHRADVMIDRTIVEFQHSIISPDAFDDRNNFYLNLGDKVVWLFDVSELIESRNLHYNQEGDKLRFTWDNPKKTFNKYGINGESIDLFFQLYDRDENSIVRVVYVSEFVFECFYTTKLMCKNEFLNYVGLKNGYCLPPSTEDIEKNVQYQAFKEKYNIVLSKQQERAMLAVEGANLLLAVPGSGKTTVLVNRLGHMVLNKGISPENILAITYTNAAAQEMQNRFSSKFGEEIGSKISFKTINSLSNRIYLWFCKKYGKQIRNIIQEKDNKDLLRKLYKKYNEEFPSEGDLMDLITAITFIKNEQLDKEEILGLETNYPNLYKIYCEYEPSLKNDNLMVFDDQMVETLAILENHSEVRNALRNKFKYICVDEAQDTSKIQHKIIQILADGNNLFMVGDEDQSIYSFRAAYPRALLNFRYDYVNPYILRMEKNFRSVPEIVEKAQRFISKNKGRYNKVMTANRQDNGNVSLIDVETREEQFTQLLGIAKNATSEVVFLYRDNESAVVLADLLLRNNIPFSLRKPEMNFFGNRVVKEVFDYLTLALNDKDVNAFKRICNKGILYLKRQNQDYAIKDVLKNNISIYDAVDNQMQYLKESYRGRSDSFRNVMQGVAEKIPLKAIEHLVNSVYGDYLEKNHLDFGKIEILKNLAHREHDIKGFLERLKYLENYLTKDHTQNSNVILSTIHSSKGLEYDSVYMVDVYDGRFPSSKPNVFSRSKDNANGEQEERRLFYVGMTRAKNNLTFFNIKDKPSQYIDEIFPEVKQKRVEEEIRRAAEEKERRLKELERQRAEQAKREQERRERQRAERAKREQERREREEEEWKQIIKAQKENERIKAELAKRFAEDDYNSRYNEVKDKFTQQDIPIYDSSGERWVQCEICGEIKPFCEFWSCGGKNHTNLGKCYSCKK